MKKLREIIWKTGLLRSFINHKRHVWFCITGKKLSIKHPSYYRKGGWHLLQGSYGGTTLCLRCVIHIDMMCLSNSVPQQMVLVDCLLPNGVIVPLRCPRWEHFCFMAGYQWAQTGGLCLVKVLHWYIRVLHARNILCVVHVGQQQKSDCNSVASLQRWIIEVIGLE